MAKEPCKLLDFLKGKDQPSMERPIYLLVGEDEYLKELAIRKTISRYIDPDFADFNVRTVRCSSKTTAGGLAATLSELPTMVEHRLLILHDLEGLTKPTGDRLTEVFESSLSEGTVVVASHRKGGTENPWWTYLKKIGLSIECSLNDKELEVFLASFCRQRGGSFQGPALKRLRERVGGDVRSLISALERCLASLAPGSSLTSEVVETLIPYSAEVALWKMTAAIGRRDHREALEILDHQLRKGESVSAIVGYLNSYLLSLIQIEGERQSGKSAAEIARSVSRKSEFQVKKTLQELASWRLEDLEAGVEGLVRADFRSKGGGEGGTSRLLLQMLILRLCSRRRRG